MSLLPISKPVAETPLASPVILGNNKAERTTAEDGNPLPATPVTLDWAMDRATGIIVDAEAPKDALSVATRMLQMALLRWEEPERGVANTNAMVCAVPIVTGLLHLAGHPDFALPTASPVPVPRFVDADPLSPSLVDAYLAWRRVKTMSSLFWNIASDLPCGAEEDATSRFAGTTDQLESVLRDRVTDFTALTDADRLLKMRCLLESDDDAFQGFDYGLKPDLIALGRLAVVPEPATTDHPETDAEWRDALTARPSLIVEQTPADLLRLFTPDEGGELFALIAAYRAAKLDAPDRLAAVLASLDAYGSFACAFGYDENGGYQLTPGALLTEEERAGLARLGHLSDAAAERLIEAVKAHRAEAKERYRQIEQEKETKRAAEDRAKHGPPTSERLIPLLPSFSEQAREAVSSLLHGASWAATARQMLAGHTAVLQTHELEALRMLDLRAVRERFQHGTQDVLRQEIDRALHDRQAGVPS